jgi:ATP-binding cassette subfamily C (CFTR/MRP) protein 1
MQSVLEEVQLWNLVTSRGGLGAELLPDSLSHGERQLLAISRAILRNRHCRCRSILILDEATGKLDSNTEEMMHNVIRKEFEGQTVISVAHKLETLKTCDVVVVLDKGKVEHIGLAETLVKSQLQAEE